MAVRRIIFGSESRVAWLVAAVGLAGASATACRPRTPLASEAKVTGGRLSQEAEFKNVVMLQIPTPKEGYVKDCTATVIADDVVLTAAHCVREYHDKKLAGPIKASNRVDPLAAATEPDATEDAVWLGSTCLVSDDAPEGLSLFGATRCDPSAVQIHWTWQRPMPEHEPGEGTVADEPPTHDLALVWFPDHPFGRARIAPASIAKDHAVAPNAVTIVGYGANTLTVHDGAPAPIPGAQDADGGETITSKVGDRTVTIAIAGGGKRRVGVNQIAGVEPLGAFNGKDGMLTLDATLGGQPEGAPVLDSGTGQGDSGGPLFVQRPDPVTGLPAYELAGVTHGFALAERKVGAPGDRMHAYFVDPIMPENAEWLREALLRLPGGSAHGNPFPSLPRTKVTDLSGPQLVKLPVKLGPIIAGKCRCIESEGFCKVVNPAGVELEYLFLEGSRSCADTCSNQTARAAIKPDVRRDCEK
jgi:hypothetical protein